MNTSDEAGQPEPFNHCASCGNRLEEGEGHPVGGTNQEDDPVTECTSCFNYRPEELAKKSIQLGRYITDLDSDVEEFAVTVDGELLFRIGGKWSLVTSSALRQGVNSGDVMTFGMIVADLALAAGLIPRDQQKEPEPTSSAWRVHVVGPDDIIEAASFEEALAIQADQTAAAQLLAKDASAHMPKVWANIIPPDSLAGYEKLTPKRDAQLDWRVYVAGPELIVAADGLLHALRIQADYNETAVRVAEKDASDPLRGEMWANILSPREPAYFFPPRGLIYGFGQQDEKQPCETEPGIDWLPASSLSFGNFRGERDDLGEFLDAIVNEFAVGSDGRLYFRIGEKWTHARAIKTAANLDIDSCDLERLVKCIAVLAQAAINILPINSDSLELPK